MTLFDQESEIYASLAHPKRLEILHLLAHKKLSVHEIERMTSLTQSAVSQHLMTLKKLLLVKSEKQAQERIYSLSSGKLKRLLDSSRSLLVDSHVLPEIFVDPVCGMEITAASAASHFTQDNQTYYFCGLGCEKQFKKRTYETHANL